MLAVRIPGIVHPCLVVLTIVQSIRSQSLDVLPNEVLPNIENINQIVRRGTGDSVPVQIFHKTEKRSRDKPDSIAYTFGRAGGVITFALPEQDWPDTKRDQVTLGFITNQSDAVLLRISSGSSSDNIEMELVDGKVFVVYNVGMMDHPIGELFDSVNDGKYHKVRFTRDGPNSTIQVDNLPVQFKYPTGMQLITFNHLAKVSIGGKKDSTGKLDKHFHGTLAGLTMNGFRILDLASEGDDRVTIDGDVELEVKQLRQTTHETSSMTSMTLNVFNDRKNYKSAPMGGHGSFIISATDAGVGCSNTKNCHQSTSDAFIKPVVTRRRSGPVFWQSTTKPFTKLAPFDKFRTYSSELPSTLAKPTIRDEKNTKKIVDQSGSQPCEGDRNDDEDCVSSGLDGIDKNSDIPEVSTKPPRPASQAEVRTSPHTTTSFQEILFTSYLSNVDGLFQSYTTSPITPFLVEVATSSDDEEDEDDLDSQGMLSRVLTDSMTDRGFAPLTGSLTMNIGLIGGIAAGVIVLLFVLVYAVYKYRAKEEEIRKLDRLPTHQSADFEFPVAGGGGASGARCHFSPSDSCDVTTNMIPVSTETANNGNGNAKRSKKRDVKEWYV